MLSTVDEFRSWAGASVASVPDALIDSNLREAEAALVIDVGRPLDVIESHPQARNIAVGDVRRRAANLLARRNSPEGYAGLGDDGVIPVPSGDPGSPAAVARIRRALKVAAGGRVVVA